MYRNLFYTAVTRAKKMVILVGREDSVERMVYNNQEQGRYTGLCDKLIQLKQLMDSDDMFVL